MKYVIRTILIVPLISYGINPPPTTYLNAPWRSDYILEKIENNETSPPQGECLFCSQLAEIDKKNYIVKRFKHCALFMNRYPYAVGHLMIVTHRHIDKLHKLLPVERAELMEVVSLCECFFENFLRISSANIGINIGKAGGGGIPQHLHIHIVPRNFGDTGFPQVLANTRIIDFDLGKVYEKIKKDFDSIEKNYSAAVNNSSNLSTAA